ncbi:Hpt domain-containing protein [Thalassotalea ganghwensis]
MSENNQLDISLLQGYLDNLGKDVVQQMLDLYKQQSVVYLQDIDSALQEESQVNWQESCHKMKGATGSVGLIAVHRHLVEIEKSTAPWSEKTLALKELKALNEQAKNEFTQWLVQQ